MDQVIPTFNNPSDVISLEAWRCLIQKEQAYLDSLIPYWQISLDTCLVGLEQALNNDSISTEWMPDWRNRYNGGDYNDQFYQKTNGIGDESKLTDLKLKVSPNPTTGICLVESDEVITLCSVFNSSGIMIMELEPRKTAFELDLGFNPQGIYFLQLYSKSGVQSSKIIVHQD